MSHQQREAGRIVTVFIVVSSLLVLVATFTWASVRQSRLDDKKLAQNAVNDVQKKAEQCSSTPRILLPVEYTSIFSLSYPGIERDGSYITTSRLKLKSSTNEVKLYLPFKAQLVEGSRYLEQGETQYMLSFETVCKFRVTYDHLSVVALEFLDDISRLPVQSSTTKSLVKISGKEYDSGAVVATRAGFVVANNTFFDFGLYNDNSVNTISGDNAWSISPLHKSDNATHGICWVNYLSGADKANVETILQPDPITKTGDYCK